MYLAPVQGFTFIELIFITVVLGLLLATSLPPLQRSWTRFQMERTAFHLAQTLRTARTLAIAQGQPIAWRWDAQAQHVVLLTQQSDGSTSSIAGRFGHPHSLPDAVKLAVLQDGQLVETISFFPDGTSQSTSLLIGEPAAPVYQIAVDGATSQVIVR